MKFSKRIIAMLLTVCFVLTGGFTVFAKNSKLDNYLFSNGFKLVENRGRSASGAQVYMNARGDMISRSANTMLFELNIYPVRQQYSNWCWAACAEMANSYYNRNYIKTQHNAVKYIYGGYLNEPGSVGQTSRALQYISDYTVSTGTTSEALSKQNVYKWINEGGPFIMDLCHPTLGTLNNHMFVCIGYICSDFDNPETITQLCIVDPAPEIPTRQYIKYNTIVSDKFGAEVNGKFYFWDKTIVTKSRS